MAKQRIEDQVAKKYRFGKAQKAAVKKHFDIEIINQYRKVIKAQIGLPNDVLWTEAAKLFGKSRKTIWLWGQMLGREGKGSNEIKERPLDDLFRYLAATARKVDVPHGSEVTSRSIAETLMQICKTRGKTETIEAYEVDLFRYIVEHLAYLDGDQGLAERMIKMMQSEIGTTYNRCGFKSTSEAVTRVKQLVKTWMPYWNLLRQSLPYRWIYWDRHKNA